MAKARNLKKDLIGNSYFGPWLKGASAKLGEGGVVEKQYKGYCIEIFFREAMNWMKQRKDRNELTHVQYILPTLFDLYSIVPDPGQQNSVFDQYPEIAQPLEGRYESWYAKNRRLILIKKIR